MVLVVWNGTLKYAGQEAIPGTALHFISVERLCSGGQFLPSIEIDSEVGFFVRENARGLKENHYATRKADCEGCPIAKKCKGKSPEKRIRVTYYRPEYERTITRLKTPRGKGMKAKRQSTVEPVFGTLTQFLGMRRINTRGISNAHKVMLMAGAAYNLKKLLRYSLNLAQSKAQSAQDAGIQLYCLLRLILKPIFGPNSGRSGICFAK